MIKKEHKINPIPNYIDITKVDITKWEDGLYTLGLDKDKGMVIMEKPIFSSFVTDTEKSKWNTASTNATNTKNIVENIKMSGSTTPLFKDGEIIIPTIAGPKGEKGEVGPQGLKGEKGDTGAKGDTGPQGLKGDTGAKGDTGPKGEKGEKGDKGDKGDDGFIGSDGKSAYEIALEAGFTGTKEEWLLSLKGNDGTMSFEELTPEQKLSLKGEKGDTGEQGIQGIQGEKGEDGHTPVKGVDYFDGEDGLQGEQGIQGPKGATGATGAKGDKGDNAYTHIKYSANANGSGMVDTPTASTIYMGVYSGTSSTAPTTITSYKWFKTQGPQGVKGDTGATGLKGDTGPKGDKGDTGAKGATGANGKDGFNPQWKTTGSTILVASNGERDLKGAKGDKGDKGAKGDTGLKGNTGDVGKSAYQVWLDEGNTGTISAYLDSLKGDKGDTGEKGDKGDAGSDANVTKDNVEIALGYTPLPQSGGILNDYVEKLVIIGEINSINLDEGNTFLKTISADTTFSIDNAKAGAHSFTLIIKMDTLSALTFPTEVKWQDGEAPDMSEANKTYILTFLTIDKGLTWFGMKGGTF